MSNKLILIFTSFLMIFFVISPSTYMQSILNGLYVWLNNVLPSLFPFFIFTKLLTNSIEYNGKLNRMMDKFTSFVFGAPKGSGYIFFIGIISGYPIGAKLLGEKLNDNTYTDKEVNKLLSYCSTSGPIFLIGSVGSIMLKSTSIGFILLGSHILGCILNGILHSRILTKKKKNITNITKTAIQDIDNTKNKYTTSSMGDIMYNSIISILCVGGFICICFVITDIMNNIGITYFITSNLSNIFNIDIEILESIFLGIIEMTRGCLIASNSLLPIATQVLICSGLISFSGISIFLQSLAFFPKEKINISYMLFCKITQSFCTVICTLPFLIFI